MNIEKMTDSFKNKETIKTRLVAEDDLLILHTDVAQVLFNGQWKAGRLGLVQFAGIVLKIWEAHYADDPYADKCLLKISDEIKSIKEKFENYERLLMRQIDNLRGFEINIYYHPNAQKYKLRFATPYPYMASVLVEKVDYLNRLIYTLKRIGIVPDGNLKVVDLMKDVQGVYKISLEWKYTGITRKDIIEKNQLALQVEKQLGVIPPAILDKEVESIFL